MVTNDWCITCKYNLLEVLTIKCISNPSFVEETSFRCLACACSRIVTLSPHPQVNGTCLDLCIWCEGQNNQYCSFIFRCTTFRRKTTSSNMTFHQIRRLVEKALNFFFQSATFCQIFFFHVGHYDIWSKLFLFIFVVQWPYIYR